jgi:hypothetical protein
MRKTDARKLETYLERKEAYEGGLDPEVERLVDALQQWQVEARLQPRPGFINEVAQQLYEQARYEPATVRRLWSGVWRRLLDGGVAAAAALIAITLFAVWFFSLPGMGQGPAARPEIPVDSPAGEAAENQAPPGTAGQAWDQVTGFASRISAYVGWLWAEVFAPPIASLAPWLLASTLLLWLLAFALRRRRAGKGMAVRNLNLRGRGDRTGRAFSPGERWKRHLLSPAG